MTTRNPRNRDDDERMVAYARREMTEAERFEFEQRLSSDPALARAYERFAQVDLVADVVARERTSRGRGGTRRWLLPAAAAALVAVAAPWLWDRLRPAGIAFDARAVASVSTASLQVYSASIGVEQPQRVPRQALRAAEPGQAAVEPRSAAEFERVVREAEARRSRTAFASPAAVLSLPDAVAVTLRFRTDAEPCSAIVVSRSVDGRWRRRYPAPPGELVFAEVANRFAPGVTHTLPRPVVLRNPNFADRVHAHAGFGLVTAEGPTRAFVLALRRDAVTDDVLADLDALLARSPGEDEVAAWLRERGFALERLAMGS